MKEHLYIRNYIKKDQPKKDNTYPLMVILHTPKCKVSISVKCSVKLSEWDTASALPKGNIQAMKHLKEIRKQLLSIYQNYKLQGKILTAKEVKSIYISENYTPTSMLYFPAKSNRTTLLHLKFLSTFKRFVRREYKLYSVDFSLLPTTLWNDFKAYISKHIYKKYYDSCLHFIGKQLLNFSLKSELKIIIKEDLKGIKFLLNPLEIERLIYHPFTERLAKIRDAFVLALHTGLSFKIIKNLTISNYRKVSSGEDFLLVKNQYNKLQWVNIGDLPKTIQSSCLKNEGVLFPLPSIQKSNAYLKEIAEICTDAKKLSFYSAVHCYRNS